jgi:hypothetical protein
MSVSALSFTFFLTVSHFSCTFSLHELQIAIFYYFMQTQLTAPHCIHTSSHCIHTSSHCIHTSFPCVFRQVHETLTIAARLKIPSNVRNTPLRNTSICNTLLCKTLLCDILMCKYLRRPRSCLAQESRLRFTRSIRVAHCMFTHSTRITVRVYS